MNSRVIKKDEIAHQQKKNAQAQAAFRAKCKEYVHTLEETVTDLDEVVQELHQSLKENQVEVQNLWSENQYLLQAIQMLQHQGLQDKV